MISFDKIKPEDWNESVFQRIGKDWMLITATDEKGNYNPMTASWGGMGVLWNKPVCFLFVRPQRYTHDFLDSGNKATLSFFPETYRQNLTYCGRTSGRDEDKVKNCGLSSVKGASGYVYYGEADLIVCAKKLYKSELKEAEFINKDLLSNYKGDDFHSVYIMEIEEILKK